MDQFMLPSSKQELPAQAQPLQPYNVKTPPPYLTVVYIFCSFNSLFGFHQTDIISSDPKKVIVVSPVKLTNQKSKLSLTCSLANYNLNILFCQLITGAYFLLFARIYNFPQNTTNSFRIKFLIMLKCQSVCFYVFLCFMIIIFYQGFLNVVRMSITKYKKPFFFKNIISVYNQIFSYYSV